MWLHLWDTRFEFSFNECIFLLAIFLCLILFFILQQAYNAIAVSRQMKLLALNSSNKSSRESSNNSEKPKEEEVRWRFFFKFPLYLVVFRFWNVNILSFFPLPTLFYASCTAANFLIFNGYETRSFRRHHCNR